MKRIFVLIGILSMLLLNGLLTGERTAASAAAARTAPAKQASCKPCHRDFTSVLPENHPAVKGSDFASCSSCHQPDFSGRAEKNAFSTRIHTAHLNKGNVACTSCHSWMPGKSFGLALVKGSWGAPTKDDMKLIRETFDSWAKSKYMDNIHAKGNIVCAGCHGKEVPLADSTVENQRCLECHGPMEKLAKETEPKEFPDRNPHKSHLGEVACTVCHKAHAASKVYCLECHKKFKMQIRGAGE